MEETTMDYTPHAIARELDQTALGYGYYGNALYTARDFDCLNHDDKLCLSRWLTGSQTAADAHHLQDIAIKLRVEK